MLCVEHKPELWCSCFFFVICCVLFFLQIYFIYFSLFTWPHLMLPNRKTNKYIIHSIYLYFVHFWMAENTSRNIIVLYSMMLFSATTEMLKPINWSVSNVGLRPVVWKYLLLFLLLYRCECYWRKTLLWKLILRNLMCFCVWILYMVILCYFLHSFVFRFIQCPYIQDIQQQQTTTNETSFKNKIYYIM